MPAAIPLDIVGCGRPSVRAHTLSSLCRFFNHQYSLGSSGAMVSRRALPARSLPEALEGSQCGRQQIFRRMHSPPAMMDERTLQMHLEGVRPKLTVAGTAIGGSPRAVFFAASPPAEPPLQRGEGRIQRASDRRREVALTPCRARRCGLHGCQWAPAPPSITTVPPRRGRAGQ